MNWGGQHTVEVGMVGMVYRNAAGIASLRWNLFSFCGGAKKNNNSEIKHSLFFSSSKHCDLICALAKYITTNISLTDQLQKHSLWLWMTWHLVILWKICVLLSQLGTSEMNFTNRKINSSFIVSIVFMAIMKWQRTEQSHAMKIPPQSGPNGRGSTVLFYIIPLFWMCVQQCLKFWVSAWNCSCTLPKWQ